MLLSSKPRRLNDDIAQIARNRCHDELSPESSRLRRDRDPSIGTCSRASTAPFSCKDAAGMLLSSKPRQLQRSHRLESREIAVVTTACRAGSFGVGAERTDATSLCSLSITTGKINR
jgi:hypothetical protein